MAGKKIRILMTTDPMGGVWTYTMDLCRYLAGHNVEVHLATLGTLPNALQQQQAAEMSHVTLYLGEYKLEWMHNPWESMQQASRWLHKIGEEIQPDLVHFNNFGQTAEKWECPVVTVFHSCVQSWWRAVKGSDAPQEEWAPYHEWVSTALHASDVVVAPSRHILAEAENIYGRPRDGRCIYNGRTWSHNTLDKTRPFIFSSGRVWDEAKNLKILEKVAARVEWPLYVAGNNSDPLTGDEVNLEGVHFLGQLQPGSVREWMSRASLYLMPALYEPFGLSVLEAAQAECALLLSNIGTFREIWGDAAYYFDPRDSEDIVQTVNQVAGNYLLRQKLSGAGLDKAHGYSATAMANGYYQLYNELLGRRVRGFKTEKSAI